MAFDDKQIDALESLEVFVALAGEKFAPYSTENVLDDNLKTLYEWGTHNLPGGLSAFGEPGAYEIAFGQTIDALRRDPDWISRADRNKQLQAEFDVMPAASSKSRYETDPEFRAFIDGQGAR